jgi:hypothetical protein
LTVSRLTKFCKISNGDAAALFADGVALICDGKQPSARQSVGW